MKEIIDKSPLDRVFILRFWQEAGSQPAAWKGELKELGATRQEDRRYSVVDLSQAFRLIARRLGKPVGRE